MEEFFSSVKSVLEKEHKAAKLQPLADVELRDMDDKGERGGNIPEDCHEERLHRVQEDGTAGDVGDGG